MPKFNNGIDLSSSVKGIGGDITGMKTPSASLGGGGISAGTVTGAVNGTIGMIQGYNSM